VFPKNPLIAVVDDEESIRKALARLLWSAGLTVQTFSSGAEFFKSFESRRPDCLVLDLHMPVMSGIEIQTRLAQTGPRIPVIVITGHDSPETREQAMGAGPSAYFRKPVDGQALLDAIEFALGQEPLKPNPHRH
jgi:FixJ family two-component response regulator